MGLVLAVVAVIAGAAYVEARRTAIATAGDRLRRAAGSLREMLGTSAGQIREQVDAISKRAPVSAYLTDPHATGASSVVGALASVITATGPASVELWDSTGRRLLSTHDSIAELPAGDARALMALARAARRTAIGPFIRMGDRIGYSVIAPVTAIGDGRAPPGFVVARWLLGRRTSSISQIEALIGSDALLVLGNADGSLWTDLVDSVRTPPIDARTAPPVAQYDRPPGRPMVSSMALIPNTSWELAVEFPRALTLAPVYAMLRRLALFTVALLILAAVFAWGVSASLTGPVERLAGTADAISAGDYSQRADVRRSDEIGALGIAFNSMVDRVAQGRESLEHKIWELADAEARYRALFDLSPQPAWVSDVATDRFLAVNAAAVTHYGYLRDEFLSMSTADIRATGDSCHSADSAHAAADHGMPKFVLAKHRTRAGAVIDVEISSRELIFGGRRARLVLANDVTDRRRVEESLRATRQRLERVIGSSGAVLYQTRLDHGASTVEWISDNVTKILGYDPAEVTAPGWWTERVHPMDRIRLADSQADYDGLREGATEYRFRHKDGRYRMLREDQRLVADENGSTRAKRVIGAWMDLTEQRQLEAQFRQAQKMEAVGRLAGGVAHDFNNLLTVILAECQYLLGDAVMDESAKDECVEQIGKAAERAALLTRQLLTFSRQQLVEPMTLDLNEVVTEVEKMLRRLIAEDVDLRISLSEEVVTLVADRGQLEQVIVNLVVNARDAMLVGGVLTIETQLTHLDREYADAHADVEPGDYVMLAISDTGTGMDDEVKSHIFEPFFTTKDDGKGTGLGLATCYAIARQYGGHIGVYSELGLGTTMKVYLPRAGAVAAPDAAAAGAGNRGTETILLVEDDTHVRRLTGRMLEARGYTVLQASDASAALEELERHPDTVHLLLTDVVLPGMGGRPLAERVRERRPEISVLFASGYSDDVILQHRLTSHGVVLLHKPFTSDVLARKVREALARGGAV